MRQNRDLEMIKSVPIAAYLEGKGIQMPAHGNLCAVWRGDRNPSVSIDRERNRWHDHGTGQGGSVIDLVMAIEGCNFSTALDILESGNYGVACFPSTSTEREPALVVDEVKNLAHPALLQYIASRGISASQARFYCREVVYHRACKPESKYFAIGFQNRAGGWELRNAYDKRATSKHYTYYDNGGSHIAVFEGFIDMLSFLQMPDCIFPKRSPENLLVLNSVGMVRRFLCDLKAGKLGAVSTACLYLDADEAGRAASAKIKEEFEVLGIRVLEDAGEYLEAQWPGCKDINDCLLAYQQQTRNNS